MSIQKAKSRLLILEPFFGYLMLKLIFKEDKTIETISTDAVHLFYNPSIERDYTIDILMGMIVHELMHCMLLHIPRSKGHDTEISNIAADYVANGYILDKTTFTLPTWVLYESKYANMTYEAVYELLLKNTSPEEKQKLNNASKKMGDFKDAPAPEKIPTLNIPIEDYWKQNVIEAVEISDNFSAGSTKGLGELLVNTIVKPQLPWYTLLNRFLTSHTNQDTNWSKPDRRFISSGLYLPSRSDPALEHVTIAIDTSCSVTPDQFKHMLAEINEILRKLKPMNLTVLQCDTDIADVTHYKAKDFPITMTMKGRGGTAFYPVFNYIYANQIRTKCLIYFTDMYGSFNFPEPQYPVLWINTDYPNRQLPPFGEIIGLNV